MDMYSLFTLIVSGLILVFAGVIFLDMKFNKTSGKYLSGKILSVITFVAYCCTLFDRYKIDSFTITDPNHILFDPVMGVFMVVLRTFTTVMVVTVMMTAFYPNRSFRKIAQYILPITTVLNIVFLKENLVAMYGQANDYFTNIKAYGIRPYGLLFTIGILVVASIFYIMKYIKDKDYKEDFKFKNNPFGYMFIVLIVLCIAFMQQGALYTIFGKYTDSSINHETNDFSFIHIVYLVITLFSLIFPYIFMRNKPLEDRKLFYGTAALSGFLQYFYLERAGLSGLPLHLCNTAVVLMFLAYVFKLKGVFYFSYFVNVLGAIFAIVMPNTEYNAHSVQSLHYWYNHIYAFALPILGVALKVYDRPNLKMMLRAIGFFTMYFFATVILNAWFNSNQPQIMELRNGVEVDYFFTYSDFFIDKVYAFHPLKYNFIWYLDVGGYTWTFFPAYQLSIYGAFVALMFVIWVVYDYFFQVSDRHYALLQVKKMQKQDMLQIKKLQKLGIKGEPYNKEEIGMVIIEHFTKRYAGAKNPSVSDFNLTINDGEVFGFIGHNGSGKSTTIKSMVGIQSLTEGRIVIDGYDITKQPLEAKLRIGYVSDNHAVYEKLTGREYVNYVADLYLVSKEDRDVRIAKYVKMFNLEEAFDREIKGYSHGMKQKLVVIASLIHNPKIWILDEPLTGLDPTSAFQIKECMRDHANNGNIVFFSSHVIEVVEKICDRICIIQRGKMVGTYVLKDLSSQGLTLEELYMKHVAQANYNTDAPDATKEFEKRKESE